jgi:hypothetical protein
MSRVGSSDVPSGSRRCLERVPKMSQAGPRNVPSESRVGLGRVPVIPDWVPAMSRSCFGDVPSEVSGVSQLGLGDVLIVSRLSSGGVQ